MRNRRPCAPANPAMLLSFHADAPGGRVAELGSLGGTDHATTTTRMNYYYSPNGGDAHGPVTAAQLTQMYSSGTLTDAAQVCQEGTETWQPISVLGVAPRKRAAISMGATALIVEVFGLLIWVGYVSQVRGPNINIVLYGIGAVSLFGGGILGLVAAIKGDGRIPGIIACVLLVLGFFVFG